VQTVYGFVWHVVADELAASEGAGGAYCRAFETESEDKLAAAVIIHTIVQRDMAACKVSECEHTPTLTDTLSRKMIMGGMTADMREIETPTNKRELVLRVISGLGSLTPEQLDRAFDAFHPDIKIFLNDPDCFTEPTQEEIEAFCLGDNFLIQAHPRVTGRIVQ